MNGLWKIPYLAEENADEDPEVQLSTATEASAQQKAKAVLIKQGKQVRATEGVCCVLEYKSVYLGQAAALLQVVL